MAYVDDNLTQLVGEGEVYRLTVADTCLGGIQQVDFGRVRLVGYIYSIRLVADRSLIRIVGEEVGRAFFRILQRLFCGGQCSVRARGVLVVLEVGASPFM